MSAAGGVQDQVVFSLGHRKCLAILGMEVADFRRRLVIQAVVDVEVATRHRFAALVGHRQAGPLGKRHRPVAVQGLHAADGDRCALVLHVAAEPQAEEVAQRALDCRLVRAVPVHPQHQLAEVIAGLAVDGEPHVRDPAVPFDAAQFQRRPRGDVPEVGVPELGIGARQPVGAERLRLGQILGHLGVQRGGGQPASSPETNGQGQSRT